MALRVRPALSCVIPVAPDMTFRPQGRARLRQESPSPNGSGAAQPATPDDSAPERTLVVHAVAQLPSDYRALVRRAYYYRWTTAQIAAELGIAEGSVKIQLHYALRTLQQTLREMGVAL